MYMLITIIFEYCAIEFLRKYSNTSKSDVHFETETAKIGKLKNIKVQYFGQNLLKSF